MKKLILALSTVLLMSGAYAQYGDNDRRGRDGRGEWGQRDDDHRRGRDDWRHRDERRDDWRRHREVRIPDRVERHIEYRNHRRVLVTTTLTCVRVYQNRCRAWNKTVTVTPLPRRRNREY